MGTKLNTTIFLSFLSSSISIKNMSEISANIIELSIIDSIDLSSAIIVVKGKSLKVLDVKKICNKYKLYYYYTQNHPSITVKVCLNKVITL